MASLTRRCCSSSIVPFFRNTHSYGADRKFRVNQWRVKKINGEKESLLCTALPTLSADTIDVEFETTGNFTPSRESRESIDEHITVVQSSRRSTLRERGSLQSVPDTSDAFSLARGIREKMRETRGSDRAVTSRRGATRHGATRCAADVRWHWRSQGTDAGEGSDK